MPAAWTAEQVLAIAPDASSAKAAHKQSNPGVWSGLGSSDRALWGLCQGSGKQPYQTVVELSGPAYISLGDGDDRLENNAFLLQPSFIHLGDGNDLFVNAVVVAEGSYIYGGSGTDTYNGDRFNVITDGFELYDQW